MVIFLILVGLYHPILIQIPSWLPYLHNIITSHPKSHVGEIGLDNARWEQINPTTKELVCPMETQIVAFEVQLHLACHLGKAVSIHSVRSWGVLMKSLTNVKTQRQQLKKRMKQENRNVDISSFWVLPPHFYFHAFSGNGSIVHQVNSICCKDTPSQTYYGFAPVINFKSPKTVDTIQTVGIDRLVLESDLEN